MSRRVRGALFVVAALAVLVIALAVSPAVGGPSVSKLAKQLSSLKKQVALIQKQQGPQGASGGSGQTGPQGPSALKLDFDQLDTDGMLRTVGTQNELTVQARCMGGGGLATLDWAVTSSVPGEISWSISADETGDTVSVTGNAGQGLAPGVVAQLVVVQAPLAGEFRRGEVQAVYRNANRVISLDLHMIANDGTGQCQLVGTAVPAS